jgi:hypothetical protein
VHTSAAVAAKMAAVVAHPRIVIPRQLTASPMIARLWGDGNVESCVPGISKNSGPIGYNRSGI